MATVFEGRPKIYANAAGVGMPYPNGGFPMPDANAPEALKARQKAIDRRLRAGPAPTAAAPTAAAPTAAAPTAAAAAEPMPKTGTLRRLAQMPGQAFDFVKAAPGKAAGLLDANVGKGVASVVQGTAKSLAQGVGRVLAPIGFGAQALQTADTPTEEYSRRTGIEGGSLRGDLLARGIGTLQDIGNNATFGVADRLGNLIAGNGFNRSAGNQVGEIGRPGQEVGGASPATMPEAGVPGKATMYDNTGRAVLSGNVVGATPALNASGAPPPPNNIVRNGNSYSGGDNVKFGANIVNPDGSQRQSGGVIRNQDVSLTFDENGRTTGSTQGTLRGGGTVSSLDTSEGYRQNLLELQRNAAERAETAANVQTAPIGIGAGASSFGDDLRAKTDAGGTGGNTRRERMQAADIAGRRDDLRLREAGDFSRNAASNATSANNAALSNATQRRSNDQNNATTLRGQELDLEGKMVPIRVAQQQREMYQRITAAATKNGFYDPAVGQQLAAQAGVDPKFFKEQVDAAQGQRSAQQGLEKGNAERTRGLFAGRFNYLLPEGTKKEGMAEAQKGLEDEAFNLARQHVAGFDSMPDEQVKAIMPKVMGMLEITKKIGAADTDWFAGRTNPGTISPTGALREQSFFQGGERGTPYGAWAGALMPRYEKGDVNFQPQAGGSIRIPNASAEAQAFLDDMIAGRDPFAPKVAPAKVGANR